MPSVKCLTSTINPGNIPWSPIVPNGTNLARYQLPVIADARH